MIASGPAIFVTELEAMAQLRDDDASTKGVFASLSSVLLNKLAVSQGRDGDVVEHLRNALSAVSFSEPETSRKDWKAALPYGLQKVSVFPHRSHITFHSDSLVGSPQDTTRLPPMRNAHVGAAPEKIIDIAGRRIRVNRFHVWGRGRVQLQSS